MAETAQARSPKPLVNQQQSLALTPLPCYEIPGNRMIELGQFLLLCLLILLFSKMKHSYTVHSNSYNFNTILTASAGLSSQQESVLRK